VNAGHILSGSIGVERIAGPDYPMCICTGVPTTRQMWKLSSS